MVYAIGLLIDLVAGIEELLGKHEVFLTLQKTFNGKYETQVMQ